MKKLINAPADVVGDMLRGLVALYPGLALLEEERVLFRSDIPAVRDTQVALVSGGGSGHEPAHGGYVGAGMLSAAVAGEVFTSPSPGAVHAAIQEVTGSPGVLLIVKNYTGDRLNFGLAAEMARAEGRRVKTVIVADDVALLDSIGQTNARGLAGTVFVHKIAGAAAASGKTLAEVGATARSAAQDVATMGLSLSAGIVPAAGKPSYQLAEDEIELGLGIHGEPGVRRMALQTANELADELVETIVRSAGFRSGERVALMVNNLGATTAMELAIFGGHAVRLLLSLGLRVERVYTGAFMTSLEAAGVSLSLLRVDDSRLELLDAPTSAPAWPNATQKCDGLADERIVEVRSVGRVRAGAQRGEDNPLLESTIEAACGALIDAEAYLTELDRLTGDGDLGINLARGARAVKAAISTLPLHNTAATLREIASIFQEAVGGSSGPLYAAMLIRASRALENGRDWAGAVAAGCDAVAELGGAQAGDRTMLDALLPFAAALQQADLENVVRAVEHGAKTTSEMIPRRGRASYLGERALGHPDAGAMAVAIWVRAIAERLGHLELLGGDDSRSFSHND